jgi:MFS family permease
MSSRDKLTCKTAFAAWLVIFTTSFAFGFNGSVLNQPFLIVRQFYNDTYTERNGIDGKPPTEMTVTILWSITNAIYVVGIMVGYFFASGLMDMLGRKNVILVGQVRVLAAIVRIILWRSSRSQPIRLEQKSVARRSN